MQQQTASAAVATASKRYRALSSLRPREASTLTTTAGTTKAGTACAASSSPATAIALWVLSNTATIRAITPNHVPMRLTV